MTHRAVVVLYVVGVTPNRVYFRISLKEGQMLSTKIKGGSGLSTNYIIRCTKNPKGGKRGGGGGAFAPPPP